MRGDDVFNAAISYTVLSIALEDGSESDMEPAIGATSFDSTFFGIVLRSLWRVVLDFHFCI